MLLGQLQVTITIIIIRSGMNRKYIAQTELNRLLFFKYMAPV